MQVFLWKGPKNIKKRNRWGLSCTWIKKMTYFRRLFFFLLYFSKNRQSSEWILIQNNKWYWSNLCLLLLYLNLVQRQTRMIFYKENLGDWWSISGKNITYPHVMSKTIQITKIWSNRKIITSKNSLLNYQVLL